MPLCDSNTIISLNIISLLRSLDSAQNRTLEIVFFCLFYMVELELSTVWVVLGGTRTIVAS